MKLTKFRTGLVFAAVVLSASPALAHTGGVLGGLQSGILHPITGPDHVVAMVAVGLWGGILRAPALWLLPLLFPLVMAFGGVLGILGVPLFGIETGIAMSGVVLGLMVALAVRAPLWIAGLLVSIFAIFHGYAHGAELPEAANPLAYGIGFVAATGSLHLIGIAIGQLFTIPRAQIIVRAAGAAISMTGLAYLTGFA
jgi:urease accessory protein